jgi:hypothetical protein
MRSPAMLTKVDIRLATGGKGSGLTKNGLETKVDIG